jgi:hypothetical protein
MKRKSINLVYPPSPRSQGGPDAQVLFPPRPTHNCYLHYPPIESVWRKNAADTDWVCSICHPVPEDAKGGTE